MAYDGVIGHLAKLFGIQSSGLAEQAPIDGHFADVVQISGTAQSGYFAGVDAHGFANGGSVAPHAQRVAVNIHVLHVNGGGEGFERAVIEAVQ